MKRMILRGTHIGLFILGIILIVSNFVLVFVGTMNIGKGLPIIAGGILLVIVSGKALASIEVNNKDEGVGNGEN